jgi:hypothetical protein
VHHAEAIALHRPCPSAAHRLVEVADHRRGLHRVALAHQGLHQTHVVFGIANSEYLALLTTCFSTFSAVSWSPASSAVSPSLRRRRTACGDTATALAQHRLRLVQRAHRLVGARQPVVGVDEVLVGVDQLLEQLLGLVETLAQEQGLGQAQARPGDRLGVDQLR